MALSLPAPALRPFVQAIWSLDATPRAPHREHVLPSGAMHLAIRLDAPLRLYRNADDRLGATLPPAVLAGTREGFHIKRADGGACVGAILRAGAAQALFGCAAEALRDRHVALDDLWPARDAARLRERLADTRDAAARAGVLQQALLARLRPVRAMHPAVAQAMLALRRGARVADAVAETGLSHRHLLLRFRDATGLTPKEYARIRRLRRALALMRGRALADVAIEAGYSDQAHLAREFRAMCGMTPRDYRAASPRGGLHVPVDFHQDAGDGAP